MKNMKQTLLTVSYRLTGDHSAFRKKMESAAAAIAATDGLQWKIWGLDLNQGRGLSVYLFEDEAAADAFAQGPMIAALRRHSSVANVVLDHTTVDRTLSLLSGAGQALSAAGPSHPPMSSSSRA
jgi:hypothetical protein